MIYGVGTHTTIAHSPLILAAIKDLGLKSIRQELWWASMELPDGSLQISPEYADRLATMASVGNDNITILMYGSTVRGIGQPYTQVERDQFLDYVRFVLPHVSPHCKYVEIWNEWNIGAGASAGQLASGQHSGAAEYVALCADVSPIIKSLAPHLVIIGCAAAGHAKSWIGECCDVGLLQHVDAVSCHPYVFDAVAPTPETAIQDLDGLQILLRTKNGGADVPVYISEMGWPTHTAGHDAAKVAGYLTRFYKLAEKRTWIKGVWWYDLLDDGVDATNREFRFGLLASDAATPKPAYHAYKALMNRTRNDQYGWCRVAVTAAAETAINGGTLPERAKRAMANLRSTNTTTTIGARTLRVMTGPMDLAVLGDIGERFADDFHIIEGPVVRGQVPAQTTATRDSTWPNGW